MSRIPDTQIATLEMARSIGLSAEEFHLVCRKLERKPTYAELGVFSAMFSEHCSYKSSKKYLRRFPTSGKRVLQGPGENAGILDIGDGWAVAFKMESHNHPSFIEPFQGAATGVGGILRDVFTMGARPIASMNGLCFGSPEFEKTPGLVRGVVKGIGDYGNCVGVPTIAGQTFFHPCYNRNILVNAFTLGIVRTDKIFKGYASGIGNAVVYVGSKTGRDGVHGATMASKEFSTEAEPERPTVQVGDPFTEKLLLEATLEAMDRGLIVGIQDMGAAGLTSSSFEMAHRAKTGLELELDRIPMRETGMTAYELLLSESQERMLLVTEPKWVKPLQEVFEKWDLHSEVIGRVVAGNQVRMTFHGETVVNLPVELVTEPPMADRPKGAPSDLKQRWFFDRNRLLSSSLESKFDAVFGDTNFADASKLVRQYDSTVGNRTQGGTFDDGAVVRLREIEGKSRRLVLTTDCNPRVCWLSPREGGRRAVAEAALNIGVRWGEPIGITDCLNFGSPENPEVMWQFEECIEGISEACEALKIPVISGNVSFYNDTDGKPVYPTPMIGMVGVIEGEGTLPHAGFFSNDLELGLIGPIEGGLGGTALASQWFKRDCGQPDDTDLTAVERSLRCLTRLRRAKRELALHDISDGGLAVAALELALRSAIPDLGIELHVPRGCDTDKFLFGEAVPRILVAFNPSDRVEIESISTQAGLAFTTIGTTNESGELRIKQGGAIVFQRAMAGIASTWKNRWAAIFG
jgi:phosphoribosylformylglycinamidine synthase